MEPLYPLGTYALTALEMLATAAFALSGIIAAARTRMDIVGVCVAAFVTAFGGGTLRDLLLDQRPFFWVREQYVLAGVLALSLIALRFMRLRHLSITERTIQWPDAIGLGLFCASGVHAAHLAGMPPLVCLIMGVVTSVFGGVLRDLICNEVPETLRNHQPYAVCAFVGGALYLVAEALSAPDWLAIAACALLTFLLRALAILRNWSLPAWRA
ncbi:MAG: trimeric intracellular cation channel family protein [Betaproteobacteria bacterium]